MALHPDKWNLKVCTNTNVLSCARTLAFSFKATVLGLQELVWYRNAIQIYKSNHNHNGRWSILDFVPFRSMFGPPTAVHSRRAAGRASLS